MNKRESFLEKYTCVGNKINADIVYREQAKIWQEFVEVFDQIHKLQRRLGSLEVENTRLREQEKNND